MKISRLFGAVAWFVFATSASADDLTKIDRTIAKEPTYQTKSPKYCLLVLGQEAKVRVWLVLDGDILYVDRNGNGDLTEEGEKVRGSSVRLAGEHRKTLQYRCSLGKLGEISVLTIADDYVEVDIVDAVRKLRFQASADERGYLKFAERPQDAPLINCGSLILLPSHQLFPAPAPRDWRYLRTLLRADQLDRNTALTINIGTQGLGAGTCTAIRFEDVPKDKHPVADIEFPSEGKAAKSARVVLHKRSCQFNFSGSLRVPKDAGAGNARITVSFPDWKEHKVAPATFEMMIEDAKTGIAVLIGDLTNEKSENTRVAAAKALAAIGPQTKDVVPALARGLADSHWLVREAAAEGLAHIGAAAKEALPALTKVLQDERPEVRRAVSYAIRKIKAEK